MNTSFFMRQAWLAPIGMLLPMGAGLLTPNYNSVSQHMSALTLLEGWPPYSVKIGAITCGISILLFAVGCLLISGAVKFSFTALASGAFGLAMVFNGIYPMGSPLHGLYGLAIFSVLVPAFYVAEFGGRYRQTWLVPLSLIVSFLSLTYMWLLLTGLEPAAITGLMQRIFTLISFGWFAVIARLSVQTSINKTTSSTAGMTA